MSGPLGPDDHNPIIPIDASYVGWFYACPANGGFGAEEGIKTIYMIPAGEVIQYDVTEAVQIWFDVRIFNKKIGLYKNYNNTIILRSDFDNTTNRFPIDTITITAQEFIENVKAEYVMSVGKLQFLYEDFLRYVNGYFSYADGFSSLFTDPDQLFLNNGVFDANSFIDIINIKVTDPNTGELVYALTGEIVITNINTLLTNIVYANPFNNRNPGTNLTLKDGFLQEDLIFIPNGVSITLSVYVMNTNSMINNLGGEVLNQLYNSCNYENGYFSSKIVTTDTDIQLIMTAPILLKLMNISLE